MGGGVIVLEFVNFSIVPLIQGLSCCSFNGLAWSSILGGSICCLFGAFWGILSVFMVCSDDVTSDMWRASCCHGVGSGELHAPIARGDDGAIFSPFGLFISSACRANR